VYKRQRLAFILLLGHKIFSSSVVSPRAYALAPRQTPLPSR